MGTFNPLFSGILDFGALIILLPIQLLLIWALICTLRRNHPGEVYAIWYAWSFFFILFLGLGFIANSNNISIVDVCGTRKDACSSIYKTLTDIGEELEFLTTIVTLALVPQLLTYLISGLFGTASAPRFVQQTQMIAVWGMIKFLAALGGILMAGSLTMRIEDPNDDKLHFGAGTIFTAGSASVAAAFFIATIHAIITDVFSGMVFREDGFPGILRAIHKWCTRRVPDTPPYTLTRTALIALLKSDAVYDFISQNRENT
jgi:hypothetical protein